MSGPEETPLFHQPKAGDFQTGSIEPVPEIPVPDRAQDIALRHTVAVAEGARAGRRERLQVLRERFERTYTTWIPFSHGELSLAVDSLVNRENRVLGRVSENTLTLTEAYYKDAKGYQNQAALHSLNLNDAKALEEDQEPSVDRIRSIPEILEH